ncbi:hypothetical protein [Streptomyces sp. NPDC101234]|uniref:hypothetical protein n=1 Tax=Streptomyces sp. NPDC101234 TaxID=3366138 RepID=UPI00382FC702
MRRPGLTRRRRFGGGLLVALALALALTVAGTALPDVSQQAAAVDAPGCSLNATSFDAETLDAADAGVRVGCAADSGSLRPLADSDDDVVAAIDFNPKDHPDQLLQSMQEVVDTTRSDQANGLSLAQSLVRRAEQVNVGIYPQQTDDDIDYDGTIQIIGNSLVIVVTSTEIGGRPRHPGPGTGNSTICDRIDCQSCSPAGSRAAW